MSFRPFGSPFYIPKIPFDVSLLSKSIAVSSEMGITIINPRELSNLVTVPDFSNPKAELNAAAVSALKAKCEDTNARTLGIVPVGNGDLMVIYQEFGVWVTKYGFPTRKAGFVRWEIRATAYAFRSPLLLLFSTEFIEVRHVPSGRLYQMIEGADIRLVQSGPPSTGPLLVAMRDASADRGDGALDQLVELLETAPINVLNSIAAADREQMWAGWGM